jgi:acid phosphatase (class A)
LSFDFTAIEESHMSRAFNASHPRVRILLAIVATAFFATTVHAATGYLLPGQPDVVALLAPPPEADSPEQAADLAAVEAAFKNRTKADEQLGKAQKEITFYSFAPVIGPVLDVEKLPRTTALFEKIAKHNKQTIGTGKDYWKRPRPYEIDTTLLHGDKEPSPSYPSGHSTHGTVYALLLAELFPEKRDEILKYGREIGWRRVVTGKHYPTDIYAGRVLGQAIVRQLHANPEFEHDFAAVKSEIDAESRTKTAQK